MTNEQVIKKFLNREEGRTPKRNIPNGIYMYEGRTLQSTGEKLINYSTVIAYFKGNELHLNTRKYSITTSKIQSKLKYLAALQNIAIIEEVQ